MIVREFLMTREDGVSLYKTYSDKGFNIKQIETGFVYGEAVDVEGALYTYEELETNIENNDEISADEFMALVEEAL